MRPWLARPQVPQVVALRFVVRPGAASSAQQAVSARAATAGRQLHRAYRIAGGRRRGHCRPGERGGGEGRARHHQGERVTAAFIMLAHHISPGGATRVCVVSSPERICSRSLASWKWRACPAGRSSALKDTAPGRGSTPPSACSPPAQCRSRRSMRQASERRESWPDPKMPRAAAGFRPAAVFSRTFHRSQCTTPS